MTDYSWREPQFPIGTLVEFHTWWGAKFIGIIVDHMYGTPNDTDYCIYSQERMDYHWIDEGNIKICE